MPLHKLSDFAALCGRKLAHVSQDKSRGKIVADANNLVDDTNPINATYLLKWQSLKEQPIKENITAENFAYSATASKPKVEAMPPEREPRPKAAGHNLYALEVEMKEKQIEKLVEDIEIQKVKKEKLHGLVIPTKMVKDLFTQHTASLVTSMAQANENHLMEMAKKLNISRADLATLRASLTNNLNDAVKKSVAMSKANLQGIIDNFSAHKTPGQKT
jgi:hypothetical protein